VEAFLAGRIRFGDISSVIAEVLETHEPTAVSGTADVMEADRRARVHAGKVVARLC
jgi:1-deoxy-D-xylulose 5-phosphate reductoisomerase